MSGTSLDGVDAVLVDFSKAKADCIATAYIAYPEALRQEILALHDRGTDELHRAATVSNRLAALYADATAAVLGTTDPSIIQAIGCHGQTVRHAPCDGYTLQLNNPALLAERTGISVVADFRSRDIAAGGQGAPLVPAFHEAVFGFPTSSRVILNIGGIANATALGAMGRTIGFDCGPGNMLMDAWTQRHLGQPYDANGQWGSQGHVLDALLSRLLAHEFFAAPPPKSCGREQFGLSWLTSFLDGSERPADVQATLCELTAKTIAQAIFKWCGQANELYVCGGGAHNQLLMRAIRRHAPGIAVAKTDALGIPADWVEAIAFAWLARQTCLGLPGNLPEVTGARGKRILGAIYPA
jgi:anhydro-N-acetylmuramic acid kinase